MKIPAQQQRGQSLTLPATPSFLFNPKWPTGSGNRSNHRQLDPSKQLLLNNFVSCVSNSMNLKFSHRLTLSNLLANMVPYGLIWSDMIQEGLLWSHMVTYGHLWSLRAQYSRLGSLMASYGSLQTHMVPYIDIYGPVLSRIDPICFCMVPYGPIWSFIVPYIYI